MAKAKKTSVYFLGAGPGDPELLTLKGKRIIEKADVIIYAGSLVNPRILFCRKKKAAAYDSASMDLQEIVSLMVKEARRGRTVARIHSGDPSLYGAISEQMIHLDRNNISYEVIPGVSSVFAAAAALKKELTVPELSQSVILTRVSGRTPVPRRESLARLARSQSTLAIFLSVDRIERVVDQLRTAYAGNTPVAVVYRASWPDEKIVRGTLATIAQLVRRAALSRHALILVGRAVGDGTGRTASKLYDERFTHGFRTGRSSKGKCAVLALTKRGAELGRVVARGLRDAHLYVPGKLRIKGPGVRCFDQDLSRVFAGLISSYSGFVCIMATGIVVRTVSPFLTHKSSDPAVVVVDEKGRFAVSLIAGHMGGANELARKVAAITGGESVITTATDVQGVLALDLLAKRLNCAGPDFALLKQGNYALLHGKKVGMYPALLRAIIPEEQQQDIRFYRSSGGLLMSDCHFKVLVANRKVDTGAGGKRKKGVILHLHPRNLALGIGCNRNTSCDEIEGAVSGCLENLGCTLESVASIATVSKKSTEKGLLAFARRLGMKLQLFTPGQLNRVACPTPPSRHALSAVGSRGVCEPAALLSAGVSSLLIPKQKIGNVTVAVAEIPLGRLLEGARIKEKRRKEHRAKRVAKRPTCYELRAVS